MILECYDLLKKMEARPVMWTGEYTLRSINDYVSGYYHALLDNKIVESSDEPFFDWVAKKLGYFESTAGWVNMILANSIGFNPIKIEWEKVFATQVTRQQHEKSIKIFYELVEEFRNEMIGKKRQG